ncbi:hypothetical protein [Ruminococcus sp.]
MILKLYNYTEAIRGQGMAGTCVQQYEAANEAELEEKAGSEIFCHI